MDIVYCNDSIVYNESYIDKRCVEKREVMCRALRLLNGKKATDLIKMFHLDKSIPVNLNVIFNRYNIPIISSDFKDLEEISSIKKKMEYKGEVLGAVVVKDNDIKIFYRKGDNRHRQKFTLAHELAHCCLDADKLEQNGHIEFRIDIDSFNVGREREANIFAGELLIPESVLNDIYKETEVPNLKFMAMMFDVSENVMKARLDYLNKPYYCSST